MTKNKKTREVIYEGSTKTLYEGPEESTAVAFFNDNHLLDNGKVIEILGKGVLKNKISAFIMSTMDICSIENHLIETINMREQLVQLVDIVPAQVVISNVAAGRYTKDLGIEEGYVFDVPIIDFRLKSKEHDYPIVNEYQLSLFCGLSPHDIMSIRHLAGRTNDFLTGMFAGVGVRLVECTLEFGRVFDGEQSIFMLADEVTPDSCRLWDLYSNDKLDFEHATKHPEKAISIYQEIARRLDVP